MFGWQRERSGISRPAREERVVAHTLAIADGYAELDGERVYEATNLRVGLFPEGEKAGT